MMNDERLAHFISETSEWSQLKRGREVFQKASELFRDLFQMDSGFFVYKKRLPSASEPFKIYNPWGKFEGLDDLLQSMLDANKQELDIFVQEHGGKWLDVQDVPFVVQSNSKQIGIWELPSRGQTVGLLILVRSTYKDYIDESVISLCVKQLSLIIDMLLAWRTADELSRYDSLTGVLNRRGIFDRAQSLLANAKTNGNHVMIGVIDIDNFKHINDSYGHLEGDKTLIEVAQTLKNHVRSSDLVGRLGGDEFVLVMETQLRDPQLFAQRITNLFPDSNGYSISVGFAVWNRDGHTWDECYTIADKRLYRNKLINK
ncbi:GGDEF domain-containing protein [Pullulanibacillus sp. KACC 23026]|uniref:GGDEF domain-containing protein n=1 Tax=Pullulanibacillus sp. KACC 23026 TaxID=3028315 RepID=UPI0023B0481D|nr:GGDEF domain-containing protein [Pullulanibacillus sp. KACC 23026]WEG13453.1 GGDEF domain-containing protein [Pullulanibacillus sp. KACC 23026]